VYAIKYSNWGDLKEDSPEFINFDWVTTIQNFAESKAAQIIDIGFRETQLNVSL
jgi:hypothetical protein